MMEKYGNNGGRKKEATPLKEAFDDLLRIASQFY